MTGYSMQVSLCPWSVADYMPTAELVRYDDGSTIPVVNFAPGSGLQINLGALSNAEARDYLHHLAGEATHLAEQLSREEVLA